MVEYRLLYQVGFFVLAPRIEADSRTIMRVMREFEDLDYIPTTFAEFVVGPQASSGKGLRLISEDEQRSINFEKNRAVFQWDATRSSNPDFESFKAHAGDVMKRVARLYGQKANRLSFITRGLLGEMSEDDLSQAYFKFVSPIDFYRDSEPKEWNVKSVSRVEGRFADFAETINVITELHRTQGTLHVEQSTKTIDRLNIAFDINTFQENQEIRFSSEDVEPFLQYANSQSELIESQIEGKIGG